MFPALSVYPRVETSWSARETDDRFCLNSSYTFRNYIFGGQPEDENADVTKALVESLEYQVSVAGLDMIKIIGE